MTFSVDAFQFRCWTITWMYNVAALYVDKLGPYLNLPVDIWDIERNAKLYNGPHPIIAHPPCGPWGMLSHLSNAVEDEKECAWRAIEQVRAFGGILEHPKGSKLFQISSLPRPGETDSCGGYTIEICQSDFGHVARKRTWLYMVGVDKSSLWFPPKREPVAWCSGSYTPGDRGCVPFGFRVASALERRLTPPALALWLLWLVNPRLTLT